MATRDKERLGAALPKLYEPWVNEVLDGLPPREEASTCDDCAMMPETGASPRESTTFFNPETKCCTYLPAIPNFLVGLVLSDRTRALKGGRTLVLERVGSGEAVTPLGFGIPKPYSLLYGHSKGAFGKARRLRCPFYLSKKKGQCGIWPYRTSICATWHCKLDRGARGGRLWSALNNLLCSVERTLALWCALKLELGDDAVARLLPPQVRWQGEVELTEHQLDRTLNPDEQRTTWGEWYGREAELFERCGQLVSGLAWSDVLRIGGPEIAAWSRFARSSYDKLLTHELPAALTMGSFTVVSANDETVHVVGYNENDPLELPRALVDVLHTFDGQETMAALDRISKEAQLELDRDLVQLLVDFRILIPSA